VALSSKTARTRNTQKDMFGRQRKKQEGIAAPSVRGRKNKYIFKMSVWVRQSSR